MCERKESWNGVKWCRHSTRLAVYLRDGLACAYCGASVEEGTRLTLDHVVPCANGGTNKPTNLVTACQRCNSSRGNRSVPAFAAAVALYLDEDATNERASTIVQHVRNCQRRKLPRAQARTMLEQRGTVRRTLKRMQSAN